MPSETAIPKGYTFLCADTFISVQGKKIAENLLAQSTGVLNPHNDAIFMIRDREMYGIMDLIDETLTKLHTKVVGKKFEDAFYILEGLIAFAHFEWDWTGTDDGERVVNTYQAIGVLCITLLRKLKAAGQLDPEHFPSLEALLRAMSEFADSFEDLCEEGGDYGMICRAMARRIFKDKDEEDYELELEQLKEWARKVEDEDLKREAKEEIKERQKQKKAGTKRRPWFKIGDVVDEDLVNKDLRMTGVWKRYRAYLE